MKTILLAILIATAITTYGQDKLITDQTWMRESKTSFRITTYNDSLAMRLYRQSAGVTSINIQYKTDRFGRYRKFSISWPKEQQNAVLILIKEFQKQ